jgi:hypothetical protein
MSPDACAPGEDPTPPERGWLFRRLYTYLGTILNLCGVGAALAKLDDPQALKWIALSLIGSNVVLATLYLAGATVTDWAKLTAAARGLRSGEGELPADQQVRR